MLREEVADVAHDFGNATFLFQNGRGQFLWRKVGDVILGVGVLAVEIAAVFQQLLGWHFPRPFIFLTLAPPLQAIGKFLELDGLGLGVIFPTFRELMFVIPDMLGRSAAVEEQDVGGDASVGGECAVRQTDDGVKVELFQEILLDAGADAITEERAIWNHHGGTAWFGAAPELAHDELEEEHGGFGGALVIGKIVLNTLLLRATERRIG